MPLEFPKQARWLNVGRPITIDELKGRIVILDFWTYCCINSLHNLPHLAEIDSRYADQPVTVIGVHSSKFEQERDDSKVMQALAKYDVRHPVVMDDDYAIWKKWNVRAWPTLVILKPNGSMAQTITGETEPGQLETIIEGLLAEGKRDNTLIAKPGRKIKPMASRQLLLRFPGKVHAERERLFIADSGHHRLLVTDLAGVIRQVIGGPEAGFVEGDFSSARFNDPQGMVLKNSTLYVADRANHAIRALDLDRQTVTTLAGTGQKGRGYSRGGPALTTPLRSPWDLVLRGNGLDIAMAGSHQIWRYRFESRELSVLAGDGVERLGDGKLLQASFAQPSGLWLDGPTLYVADSETSSIRALHTKAERVTTLVGTGLYDFGRADGRGRLAQLQHPLGVTGRDDRLYVADSFNNLIRTIDLEGDGDVSVDTLELKGVTELNEPSGLSVFENTLYMADTNHHRILTVDLLTHETRELSLSFPED